MVKLEPLVDFPAIVGKVQSMADGGLRLTFDLPETAVNQAAKLMNLRERYLQVVVYDADEFQTAIDQKSLN